MLLIHEFSLRDYQENERAFSLRCFAVEYIFLARRFLTRFYRKIDREMLERQELSCIALERICVLLKQQGISPYRGGMDGLDLERNIEFASQIMCGRMILFEEKKESLFAFLEKLFTHPETSLQKEVFPEIGIPSVEGELVLSTGIEIRRIQRFLAISDEELEQYLSPEKEGDDGSGIFD